MPAHQEVGVSGSRSTEAWHISNMQVARFQRVLPYWEGSLPRSCNCPLNGLYVLKPHGRSSSLRRAFRSWEYARRAASENAQSTNLAIISSSLVCTSKRAKNSLGIRIDGMSCLHKENHVQVE